MPVIIGGAFMLGCAITGITIGTLSMYIIHRRAVQNACDLEHQRCEAFRFQREAGEFIIENCKLKRKISEAQKTLLN
jgi:hypothetical protein